MKLKVYLVKAGKQYWTHIRGDIMEKKEFEKALRSILELYGFKYIKKGYYRKTDELIAVIATQKSNFDADSYYLNYGFLIKQLNPDMEYPKDYVCDVIGRFLFKKGTKSTDTFNLELNSVEELEEGINEMFHSTIIPVLEKGIQEYYIKFPEYIVMATSRTKKYLGLDG